MSSSSESGWFRRDIALAVSLGKLARSKIKADINAALEAVLVNNK